MDGSNVEATEEKNAEALATVPAKTAFELIAAVDLVVQQGHYDHCKSTNVDTNMVVIGPCDCGIDGLRGAIARFRVQVKEDGHGE